MKKFDIRIIESNLNREDFSPIERKEVVSSYIIDDEVTPITEELVKGVLEYKWVDAKRFFLEARDKEPFKKSQSIEDRLAQERKKVVQELKNWCDNNFNWVGDGTGYDGQDYNEMIGSNNTINKLRKFLDQIERGTDETN